MEHILGWPAGVAPIDFIEIATTKGPNTPHPIFWPHKMFQEMYAGRRDDFDRKLLGPAGGALSFWRSMRDSPYVRNHPNLPEQHWRKTIPLGMHGDGGKFSKQDGVYVFSWNSLLQIFGPTMDTRYLFCRDEKSRNDRRKHGPTYGSIFVVAQPVLDWRDAIF
jgi:hypothetical protein